MENETPTPPARPARRRRRLYETADSIAIPEMAPNSAPQTAGNSPAAEDLEPTFYAEIAQTPQPAPKAADTALIREPVGEALPVAFFEDPEHVRKTEKIIREHVLWSMGMGLVPLPWLDMMTISVVQLVMVYRLCRHYQHPFMKELVTSHIAILLGGANSGFLGKMTMHWFGAFIPLLNIVSIPLIAGVLTYAIARTFILHFESGGTLLTFDAEKMRAYFLKEQENAKQVVLNLHKENQS